MGTGRRAHEAAATAGVSCTATRGTTGPALRWNREVKSAHETIPLPPSYLPTVHESIGTGLHCIGSFLSTRSYPRSQQSGQGTKPIDMMRWRPPPPRTFTNPTNDTGGRAAPMRYARLPQQQCSCSAGEICRRQWRRCSVFGVATCRFPDRNCLVSV